MSLLGVDPQVIGGIGQAFQDIFHASGLGIPHRHPSFVAELLISGNVKTCIGNILYPVDRSANGIIANNIKDNRFDIVRLDIQEFGTGKNFGLVDIECQYRGADCHCCR